MCSFVQLTQCAGMNSTAKVVLILLLILTASCARQGASKPSAAQARGIYATPVEVFDACREAEWKGEWRKCLDCYTPDAQKNMMFELIFSCGVGGSEIGGPLLVKKFVDAKWATDYHQKFEEKFGMDPATFREKMRTDPTVAAMEAAQHQLLCDVVAAHVKDKAGFFEAVRNMYDRGHDYGHLGELKQVTVEGDTASGQAVTIYQSLLIEVSNEGKRIQKVVRSRYDKTFRFRKVNGGWLIEQ
jgi:hypothetical protein